MVIKVPVMNEKVVMMRAESWRSGGPGQCLFVGPFRKSSSSVPTVITNSRKRFTTICSIQHSLFTNNNSNQRLSKF